MTKEQADLVRAALGSYRAAYGKRRGMSDHDRAMMAKADEARAAFLELLAAHAPEAL